MDSICFHCGYWQREKGRERSGYARCLRLNSIKKSTYSCVLFSESQFPLKEVYCRSCKLARKERESYTQEGLVCSCSNQDINPCIGLDINAPRDCSVYIPIEDTPWKQTRY
jgi:hypothetical protein